MTLTSWWPCWITRPDHLRPSHASSSVGDYGGGRGVFEALDDWEVEAVREGELQTCGFFRQSYPEDAVLLLIALVRAKFAVPITGWGVWAFWCVARDGDGRPRRTLVFEISPTGRPMCLADSNLGGFLQRDEGAVG